MRACEQGAAGPGLQGDKAQPTTLTHLLGNKALTEAEL